MIQSARDLIIELLYNGMPLTPAQDIVVEMGTVFLVFAVLAVPVTVVFAFICMIWEAFRR